MEDEPSSQESQIEEQKTEDISQSPQLDIDRLKHHVRQQGRLLDALSRKNESLERALVGTSSKMDRLLGVLVEERKERRMEVSALNVRVETLNDKVHAMRLAFRSCKKKLIEVAANAIVDKHKGEI
ncbi:hypothetical protein TrCOL_g7417 [Triparma columacea]|uniref:Uncharacterized protein n=1 Tax=Triparma columacea TaxID=722753 RepID=A0A9W7FXQ2_9STRA|nr:hypothetical protein TrCOL_g7417 [Triparma columacea]